MKLVILSDTHGKHNSVLMPEGDCVIHAGDITSMGKVGEVMDFLSWFSSLPYTYKIFCAGNHDWLFENQPMYAKALVKEYPDVIYLENSGVSIGKIKIYGSPITPFFLSWAFNRQRGEQIKKYWDAIPDDTDILITHGPPHGILDSTPMTDGHVGCEELSARVEELKPRIHCFGHIHSAAGISKYEMKNTTFINASVLNDNYKLTNKPIIITI